MSDTTLDCSNHPDRAAIEKCEVCGKPLCGYCLYYTDDGQRLCEQHAQIAKQNGLTIIPPAVYADGIIASQAEAKRQALAERNINATFDLSDLEVPKPKGAVSKNRAIYQGNNNDLNAFLGMLFGVLSFSACCGLIYCLPFAAVLMGFMAIVNAKEAIDPRRTRQQGYIAILTGGVFALGIAGCVIFYVATIAGASTLGATTYNPTLFTFPTNTVTPAPISTHTPTPNPAVEPLQQTATADAVGP
jgi:hypothetical protein